MSMVDGPPPIQSRIADLRRRFRSSAFARSVLVSVIAGIAIAEAPAKVRQGNDGVTCQRELVGSFVMPQ